MPSPAPTDKHAISFDVARQFRAVGAENDSRGAVLAPNRVELLNLYFGLARLGAVQVPLNPFLTGEFLRH